MQRRLLAVSFGALLTFGAILAVGFVAGQFTSQSGINAPGQMVSAPRV